MLRRILKWTAIAAGALVGLLLVAIVVIYIAGGRVLAQRWDVPLTSIAVLHDSAAVEEGRRLAAIHGCTGCHSKDLSGGVLIDEPLLARISSPNLTKPLARYSNEELVRVIRHGVWPDGKGSAAMPSSMFYHLSDRDAGSIIAFLRSAPPVKSNLPTTSIRLMARLGLVLGQYQVQADMIDHDALRIPSVTAEGGPNGRYLAFTSCTECHGQSLEGGFNSSPPLTIVRAYSLDEFTRLMQIGVPRDGRELRMMGGVARSRFTHFSEEEIAALHGYLQSMEMVVDND